LPVGSRGGFVEHFRLDRFGDLEDTQYRLVPHEEAYAYRGYDGRGDGEAYGGWWAESDNRRFTRFPYWRDPPRVEAPWRGLFSEPRWWSGDERSRPRRIDPDYFWGNRHYVQ
jgi:penicillin-binding protein 1A